MAADWSKATVHRGKISGSTQSLDYEFWRHQSEEMKMAAVWEMIIFHQQVRNRDPAELRLNRSVGGLRKKRR
jgi:hypothetical protein